MSYKELLIGCGHARDKRIKPPGTEHFRGWCDLTTLDANPNCAPDIVYDLVNGIYLTEQPFPHSFFNEIHAYEVLEHCGEQGAAHLFFLQFRRFWEWLKPNGYFCATVPHYKSLWAWGDPSHTRIINHGTLIFLSKKEYAAQLGKTSMSDFLHFMGDMDFNVIRASNEGDTFTFILQAIKPAYRKCDGNHGGSPCEDPDCWQK